MSEAKDPIDSARQLLARSVSSPPAIAAWSVEAERVIASLDASMVSLDYRARQLLQQTGDLRAAAREKSLFGRFQKSADERSNQVEQARCLSTREVCRSLIEQLRGRMNAGS